MNIGIIGTESFHSKQFAKIMNKEKSVSAVLTSIYDPDINEAEKFSKEYDIFHYTDNIKELTKNCDAVMITTRDASLHKEQAYIAIEAGLPVWVDKAFTDTEASAKDIVSYAKEKNVILDGGTTFKRNKDYIKVKELVLGLENNDLGAIDFSFIGSPLDKNGGLKFYCSHLVEECIDMFGGGYKEVFAYTTGRTTVVIISYDTFDVYLRCIPEAYNITCNIFKLSGNMSFNLDDSNIYLEGLTAFIDTINGKIPPYNSENFVLSVKLMQEIEKSLENSIKGS